MQKNLCGSKSKLHFSVCVTSVAHTFLFLGGTMMEKEYLYVRKSNKLHIKGGCGLNPESRDVESFETFDEAINSAKDGCLWCKYCWNKIYAIKNKYGAYKNCKIIGLIFLFLSIPLFISFPIIINDLEPSEEATKALLIIILIVLALLPICLFLCAYRIKKKNYDTFIKYKDYLGISWNTELSSGFKMVLKPLGILLVVGILIVGISAISKSCSNPFRAKCKVCNDKPAVDGTFCEDCFEKFNDDEYGFSDYLKEQDPNLYDSIKDNYDSIKDEYNN